jgi:hypothetical protein
MKYALPLIGSPFVIRWACISPIFKTEAEKSDSAVTILIHIRETFSSNLGRDTGYDWGHSWLSSVSPGNAGLLPRLDHDRFLPYPYQSIILQLSYHSSLYALRYRQPHTGSSHSHRPEYFMRGTVAALVTLLSTDWFCSVRLNSLCWRFRQVSMFRKL